MIFIVVISLVFYCLADCVFLWGYNGFRTLCDLLSFVSAKESKQRKASPIKLLFLISTEFS
ncbi:hypothetical protein C3007_07490 [Avibacterium gallinarum]|nr:hypothetical protein C3007_07490 [Avibacterium gallinarum]